MARTATPPPPAATDTPVDPAGNLRAGAAAGRAAVPGRAPTRPAAGTRPPANPSAPAADGEGEGEGINAWGIGGGILGVIIAYIVSSMFGGGWLGTIGFLLLAIPAAIMGSQTVQGWASGSSTPATPAAGGDTPARDRAAAPQTPGQPPPVRVADSNVTIGAASNGGRQLDVAMLDQMIDVPNGTAGNLPVPPVQRPSAPPNRGDRVGAG